MFTMQEKGLRRSFGAAAAAVIVTLAGMTIEFGHANALCAGTVEVGELQPLNLEQLAMVTLPGLTITAGRLADGDALPAVRDLPDHEIRLAQAGTQEDVRG